MAKQRRRRTLWHSTRMADGRAAPPTKEVVVLMKRFPNACVTKCTMEEAAIRTISVAGPNGTCRAWRTWNSLGVVNVRRRTDSRGVVVKVRGEEKGKTVAAGFILN